MPCLIGVFDELLLQMNFPLLPIDAIFQQASALNRDYLPCVSADASPPVLEAADASFASASFRSSTWFPKRPPGDPRDSSSSPSAKRLRIVED